MLSKRVRNKAAAVAKALRNAKPNQELVAEGFREHLRLLKLPKREIIFYPNLWAACDSDTAMYDSWDAAMKCGFRDENKEIRKQRKETLEKTRIFKWFNATNPLVRSREPSYEGLLIEARDAAWGSMYGCERDKSVDDVLRTDRSPWSLAWASIVHTNSPYLDPFINIAQGGCLIFWVGKHAVHVVLASIHFRYIQRQRDPLDEQDQERNMRLLQLHREDGPAIEYEDGSGIFYWHGRGVPREVVETDKLTVEQILTETNAEIRRLMMERYGQQRFICDAKAEVLDKRGDDELIRIPLANDPEGALVALKVQCPSSGAIYVLRVPPDQTKVSSALAWTFGYERVKDYKLQAET